MIMGVPLSDRYAKYVNINPDGDGFTIKAKEAEKEMGVNNREAVASLLKEVEQINSDYEKIYGTKLINVEV